MILRCGGVNGCFKYNSQIHIQEILEVEKIYIKYGI